MIIETFAARPPQSKYWLRFQSTAHLSIIAICISHLNIAPEAVRTHSSATLAFHFSCEDPDTFNVASADSQQKCGMLYLRVDFY